MNLTITESAESAFGELAGSKKAPFVRVSAGQACGCGRIGYSMSWEEDKSTDDVEVPIKGLALVVDAESMPYVEGGVIDYHKEEMQEGFVIQNPNVQSGCSCGH